MYKLNSKFAMSVCALAVCATLGEARAQEATLETVIVTAVRANRVSKGATGLPLEMLETPQSISTIDRQDMQDFATTGTLDALRLGTGINVDQWETNRATVNSRGFEIQLTQIDGLGMTNDWGVVTGQMDAFLFESIEIIRGANGLLTGVGNSSGTINYIRKRPKNEDSGYVSVYGGSHNMLRGALDYNKVFTQDGSWAGRFVVAYEDTDSYIRSLNNRRATLYGVVDGQIGTNGVLTVGVTYQDSKQESPMWGSLTLNYANGTMADFPVSSSTSQDWTFWNTNAVGAFVEYVHTLNADWQAKLTYNYRRGEEDTRLLYAYSLTGYLNDDNTGLYGWPYASFVKTDNNIADANISGTFSAWGRRHSLLAGVSWSRQSNDTEIHPFSDSYMLLPMPAFPFGGDVYPQPDWGPLEPNSSGEQTLTRFYAASRLSLMDRLAGIVGVNSVKLEREGSSIYGNVPTVTTYPDTKKTSPYVGFTYDFTPTIVGYLSYSTIFQNQDQTDLYGAYLPPMEGLNYEAGVKAEWLGRKLLTTFAVFKAEQDGLATYAGMTPSGNYYYVPQNVDSTGVEFEATGQINQYARLTFGITHLKLDGPEGDDTNPWIPRTTANLRIDSKLPMLPELRMGLAGRWQSETSNGALRQGSFFVANVFAAYQLTNAASVQVNVNNLFDEKYVEGLAYGAMYGAPRAAFVTLDYRF